MGNIQKIATKNAPEALGPYSQGILAKQFLFISGQVPVNPVSGKLVENNITAQTTQVLNNIAAILEASGLTVEHVVRSDIFMLDLKDFQVMNSIYGEFFKYPIKPARQTIQVARLPLDALIEISCIAFKEDAT